jgi:hypothetical protein
MEIRIILKRDKWVKMESKYIVENTAMAVSFLQWKHPESLGI